MDKNELFEMIESQGYDSSKLDKNDIRKNFVDFLGTRIEEIQQLKNKIAQLEESNSKQIVNTSITTPENSKEMVKTPLMGVEQEVYDLLETPMRFSDIVERSGKSKQQIYGILKELLSKEIVKKITISKKNVVYERA